MINELAFYQVSKSFVAAEFLPVEYFDGRYTLKQLLAMIPTRIIGIAQGVRDRHGKMICNDKYRKGKYNYRGLRTKDCAEYNPKSWHNSLKAIDLEPKETKVIDIHDDIEKNPQFYKDLGVTAVESIKLAPSWMHFSIQPIGEKNSLFIILKDGFEKRL